MLRGEIWLVNLDARLSLDIHRTRPCVIVNNDILGQLPNKVVVPIVDWNERYAQADWMVKIEPNRLNGLTRASAADAFQIRSVSQERLIRQMGVLTNNLLLKLNEAIDMVVKEL
jgi:mRNA interferase MazF